LLPQRAFDELAMPHNLKPEETKADGRRPAAEKKRHPDETNPPDRRGHRLTWRGLHGLISY